MNFFKLFFLVILIVSFNNNVSGHGPSRQKVNEKIEINANPEKVWEIVKNFMKYDWNSSIKKVIAENNEVGAERKLEFDEGIFVPQPLQKLDCCFGSGLGVTTSSATGSGLGVTTSSATGSGLGGGLS